jgi:hypothetical protein
MWQRFAICLALLCTVRGVHASEDFPDVIRATIATEQPLPCTLCHTLADGGDAEVTTVFGRNMFDFGMKGGDPASLQRAIRRNATRGWDSDGDGVPDIAELMYGSDPSSLALSSSPELMHGCSIGPVATRWHVTLLFFAAIAWAFKKRRCHRR